MREHIASMEQQLARAMEETSMLRGGIVACNQLLLHLNEPEPSENEDSPGSEETGKE